jgi:hypothetical protein
VHSLSPWSRVHLEKQTGFQLVKNFPAFYGTRRFIIAFTSGRHLSLSWASSIQSVPSHHTSWCPFSLLKSYLIISSGPRLSVWIFRIKIRIYGEELLAPRPNPKLEDHPLSEVRDCLLKYSQLLCILEAVPQSAAWGRAMPWWQVPYPLITVPPTCSELNFKVQDGEGPYVVEFEWHTPSQLWLLVQFKFSV